MRKNYCFLGLFSLFIIFFGCQRIDIAQENFGEDEIFVSQNLESVAFNPGKAAVLGEPLDIPYRLEVMEEAVERLRTKGIITEPVDEIVKHTHSYLRLIFAEEEQYITLLDAGIDMDILPLDLNILEGGYIIEDCREDSLEVRYCVVPVEEMDIVEKSGAQIDVLMELFMPDEEEYQEEGYETRSGSRISASIMEQIEREAYILTGNEDWLSDESSCGTRANKIPSGRITYKDPVVSHCLQKNEYNTIGMEGLEVKAIRLLKTAKGKCDANGYFTCDKSFANKWSYRTVFETYQFKIHQKALGNYAFTSSSTMSSWNYEISDVTSEGYFEATIFRAAYHYYYKDIQGIRRPPQNGFWKAQMKIAAHFEADYNQDGAKGDTEMSRRFLGLGNPIKVYRHRTRKVHGQGMTDTCHVAELYNTVIHELAHTSHWNHSKKQYNQQDAPARKVQETWATGVGFVLTRMRYPTWDGMAYLNADNYTDLVVDLMDTKEEGLYNKGFSYSEGDKVEGYTLRQIEDALVGAASYDQWKNNLYSQVADNPTRDNLDMLFRLWSK